MDILNFFPKYNGYFKYYNYNYKLYIQDINI